MKNGFQKIVSLLMACIVLFSTFSFTVEKHYCGSFLVDISIFTEAKSCGMEMMLDLHMDDVEIDMKRKSCCKNEVILFEGQDELKTSLDQIDVLQQQVFITSFFHSYLKVFEIPEEKNIIFKEYTPPDLVRDVHILHETFLI